MKIETPSNEIAKERSSVQMNAPAEEVNESDSKPADSGMCSFLKSLTTRQKLILLYVGWINLAAYGTLSIMSPFFPSEAEKKGMTETTSGLVFACYALVMGLMSPVWGKLVPKMGTKYIIAIGILLDGVANIVFGSLNKIEDLTAFTVSCFVVRSFEAVGGAAFFIGGVALLGETFPESIGTAMGMLEIFAGVGVSIGPVIGGLLYDLGGYGLPFYVLGAVILLNVPLTLLALPSLKIVKKESGSFTQLLKSGLTIATAVVLLMVCTLWMFLQPTLSLHLQQLSLSATDISLFFLLMSGFYAIFCPIMGAIGDKMKTPWILMMLGAFFCSVCFLLIGPCPWVFPFIPNSIWSNILGLSLCGMFFAAAVIPSYSVFMTAATTDLGLPADSSTYGIVGGFWGLLFSLGQVIGPMLGGILMDDFGFPVASSIVAFVCIGVSAIVGICLIVRECRIRPKSPDNPSQAVDSSTENVKIPTGDKCYVIRIVRTNEFDQHFDV